jgi:hypothetical protein
VGAALAVVGCGSGGSGGGVGLGMGGCLTDQQICQFTPGVSTQNDVRKALGNAQGYEGTSAIYICQEVSGSQIVHNDLIVFDFDMSGTLMDVMVERMGTGATPPPNCSGGQVVGSSGSSGGSSGGSGSGCGSVTPPPPNSTSCQGVVNPATNMVVETVCTDQSGHMWGESCSSPQNCGCYYDSTPICTCSKASASAACCPGVAN